MAHDKKIGTAQQICYCANGLHQDTPSFRIAKKRGIFDLLPGLLAFPDLIAEVVDHRVLEFIVSLRHGGQSQPFHNRIGIFQSVAETACGRVNNDPVHGHTQVFKKNVDLFCQVDIDGGGGDNGMPVSHCRCADSFVVLFLYRPYNKVFPLTGLCDRLENDLVFCRICASPDYQRYRDGPQNLFDCGGGRFRTSILIVGINAFQLQNDCLCAELGNTFFRPGSRICKHILELHCHRFRPVLGNDIPNFHCNDRLIRHVTFEGIERVTGFATDFDGRSSLSNGNFLDAARIGFLLHFKSHVSLLTCEKLVS